MCCEKEIFLWTFINCNGSSLNVYSWLLGSQLCIRTHVSDVARGHLLYWMKKNLLNIQLEPIYLDWVYNYKGCRFSDIRKRQKTKNTFSDITKWYFDFWLSNMPFLDITNNSHFLISKLDNYDIKKYIFFKIKNYSWYQEFESLR